MVNYYHRFIPHCAEKLTPLNNLLTEANEGQNRFLPKSNFELHWTENANVAFIESKQILANATLLVHPQQSAPLNITCDASDFVLQQCIDNVWQPLSFFSKKLSPAETRYSAFDRELLAVYSTIRHFRHNLEGREFKSTKHLAFIAEFTTDIRHVKGETNFAADALSPPTVSVIEYNAAINYKDLSKDQASDKELIRLRHSTTSNMEFRLLLHPIIYWSGATFQQDVEDHT